MLQAALFVILLVAGNVFLDEIPVPEPCPGGENVCGGDPEKYPSKQIGMAIEGLKMSPETRDRFFGNTMISVDVARREMLAPTCDHRTSLVPQYARARNMLGKWLYVAQTLNQTRQLVELSICIKPSAPCNNDIDSPDGENSTTCKQIFRTYNLLAFDENGEVVVDPFKFPSSCSCHYKSPFGINLRSNFNFGPSQESTCPPRPSGQSLQFPTTRSLLQESSKPMKLKGWNYKIWPCEENLCESTDGYPHNLVERMLQNHIMFKSPSMFGTLFGETCGIEDDPARISIRSSSFEEETPLCESFSKFIYPTKGLSLHGEWMFIINTKKYKQGVEEDKCLDFVLDSSCTYGGTEGRQPDATICKQDFRIQHLLAIRRNGDVAYEAFKIPSGCTCFIKDKNFFGLN